MTFPQLRVRTEFNFKLTFGPLPKIVARLAEIGCPTAAIVDDGTWGHVRWAKALERPMFGTDFRVERPNGDKPKAWALATDMKGFYRFSSAVRQNLAPPEELLSRATGLIRFAGAALDDPELFDYVDIHPGSMLAQRRAIQLARRTGKPLVVTSDNAYPAPADYSAFRAIIDRGEKLSPQHILTADELRAALPILSDEDFTWALARTHEIAERCATQLPRAPLIHFDGDLRALAATGKDYRLSRGHIAAWTEAYEARLQRELDVIAAKNFESYFLVVADLVQWAKERMLVGPARGSSAGSLLCYLLRITEVDPIVHELLFERFIDLTRNDLPDIDIDFSDVKRDQCFTYLAEKYGAECVARIGNINTFKPRSLMKEVGRRLAIPMAETFPVLNVLIEYSSGDSRYGKGLEDTLANTEHGRYFSERHPEAKVMTVVENHASHTGVHAAGVIVANVPVVEYCTVGADGVAQLDKPDSEHLNLLKIDALGLRTLGVIEDAGVVTAEELYALKLNDPKVFAIFNAKKYSGIFQFEGQAQRSVAAKVHVDNFRTIDHVTALARPGPLGGGAANRYILRHGGHEQVETTHPSTAAILEDTYGVVLYQEQVMRIVREVGKFSWEETSFIRKAISGRKGKEWFDKQQLRFSEGAATDGIDEDTAAKIWAEICSFGAWGMNRSHTCSYAIIGYWCAWMKAYHPLAYTAACLRNAKDDAQAAEVLRELVEEGADYVPFDLERSRVDWSEQDGALVGGFKNLVGYGDAKASAAVEARAAGQLTGKALEKVLAAEVKFTELYPLRRAWREIYADPEGAANCSPGSRVLLASDFPDEGDVLWLCKVNSKQRRDENETVRVAKRRGRLLDGKTLFVDLKCADDTQAPFTVRIDRWDYDVVGSEAFEQLVEGQDVLLIRGQRIRNFPMVKVNKIKCLTQPALFQRQPRRQWRTS